MSKDEQILKNHFHDLAERAYQRGIPTFSGFVEKYHIKTACQAASAAGVCAAGYGGYPDALRQIICFYPASWDTGQDDLGLTLQDNGHSPDTDNTQDLNGILNYPIECIKITPVNKHFCDNLSHRDYLGSVMNLGIERNQVGDIIVKREGGAGDEIPAAYIFCNQNKSALIEGISRIKHTTVCAVLFEGAGLSLQQDYKEFGSSVSSYRLDAVLAVCLRISRGQCIGLIQEGRVSLNGKVCTENAKQVNNGDVLSVRGYGKYIIESSQTVTRKGRLHIKVKQYI